MHKMEEDDQEIDLNSPGPSTGLRVDENLTSNGTRTHENGLRKSSTPKLKKSCKTSSPKTNKKSRKTCNKTPSTTQPLTHTDQLGQIRDCLSGEANEMEYLTQETETILQFETNKKNVKRNTATGDEYQRILQILIRHRGFQTCDIRIGSEVSDVLALDDVVYCTEESCRFFQIKHSNYPTKYPVKTSHIFKSSFPQKQNNEETPPKTKNKKCNLHLVLYFKGFLEIKKNSRFGHLKIEEVTFITNQSLIIDYEKYKSCLTPLSNGLKDDELLHLQETTAVKYSLNVTLVRELFKDYLEKEYKKYFNIAEKNLTDQIRFEELVTEFLTTIRIVFNYPDLESVREFTMSEIFGESFHCKETRENLLRCLVHMEIELLTRDNEYLTYEEWKINKDKVTSLIDQIKVIGITDYESNALSRKGELVFDDQSINDMIRDLENFLKSEDCSVLHICPVKNVELNAVNVFNFLNFFSTNKPFYCRLKGLLSTNVLLDKILEEYDVLVLWNSDVVVDGHDYDNCPFKKFTYTIFESLKKYPIKKLIFISQNKDFFCSCIQTLEIPNYCQKQYRHGLKVLSEASKKEVLNKVIIFQGKFVSFGSIFQNDLAFAEEIIDEDCLWELMNPRKQKCTVFNTDAFSSPGYDKNYYIPRTFCPFDHAQKSRLSETRAGKSLKSENKMIELLESEKTIIVVGDSGVGKSTVLTQIANLLNEKMESVWIVRVNLRHFFTKNKLKEFGNVKGCESASKMVFKMAFPNGYSNLEKTLFEKGLKEKKLKLIILLDGFNEIGVITQNRVCEFVNTCLTNFEILQCWITTQIQNKEKIETMLNVESYLLSPLNDEDQINLLVKYWTTEYAKRNPPELHNDSDLRSDAIDALNNWKQCISDENEKPFTSISLNLKMLADILLEKNRKLNVNLKLFDLYETFVNYKFSCYTRETSGCQYNSDPVLDEAKENLFAYSIRKVLQEISAERIISDYARKEYEKIKKKIPGMDELEKYKSCVGEENQQHVITLSKIGLLTVKNGEFELSHFSYAQFFFSEYLVIYLNNNHLQHFLMNHVMSRNSLWLCRRFIDRIFMRHLTPQNRNDMPFYYRKVPDVLKDTKLNAKAQNIFMQELQSNLVMEENLLYIMKFVLKKLDNKKYMPYFKKTIKHSFNAFIKDMFVKDTLDSIESLIKDISERKICDLLEEKNLIYPKPKSYYEAAIRAKHLLEVLQTSNSV